MARKKTTVPQHDEPENEAQDTPGQGGQPEGKQISKTEAIRQAMAAGMDSPEDGVNFIKDQFGIEMSRQHFSATRSQIRSREAARKEAASKGKPGRKPKQDAGQAVEGYLAPPPQQGAAGDESDLLAAMEAMKPLVASLGAEKVKRIVDLLG